LNLQYISEYHAEKRHLMVKMTNDDILTISQSNKKTFIDSLQRLNNFDIKCLHCLFCNV
jgi:hypothetical protein